MSSLVVNIHANRIDNIDGRSWHTRSTATLRFLAALWLFRRAHDRPVALVEIAPCLGTTALPRQMQRIIDWLEQTEPGLVEFETRTVGRYRLARPPEFLCFDRSPAELLAWLGIPDPAVDLLARDDAPPDRTAPPRHGELADWTARLLRADSSLHDGQITGDTKSACAILGAVDPPLDAGFRPSHLLRQAFAALRASDLPGFETACGLLAQDVRTGRYPHDPHIESRLLLLRAKAHLDRGNEVEAERLIRSIRIEDCADIWTRGRYFNMAGLVAFRRWRKALRAENPSRTANNTSTADLHLHQDESARITLLYGKALACELQVMDYQGIQATTFNLANTCLTPLIEGLSLAKNTADQYLADGLEWVRLCQMCCAHFFVGMDSVWAHILVLEVALTTDYPFHHLNEGSGRIFGSTTTMSGALKHTLSLARKLGNPVEIETIKTLIRQAQQLGLIANDENHWPTPPTS